MLGIRLNHQFCFRVFQTLTCVFLFFWQKPRKMKESGGMNGCIKRGSEPDIPYCVRVAELEAGDVFVSSYYYYLLLIISQNGYS